MRRTVALICVCALVPMALSGCSDIRRAFGQEKTIPNEFDVVQNAPLAIPPDFNLRPPRPGATPSQSVAAATQAKETIFRATDQKGGTAVADAQVSPGEDQIIRAAGAGATNDANIRDVINREASESQPFNRSFVDELMFWRTDTKKTAKGELLDPVKESARLSEQKGGGTGAATLATEFSGPPTIERQSDSAGLIDRLF